MNDRISMDFERVAQTATSLAAAATAIGATLDRMDATLAVVESQWQGDAFVAYRAARMRWETQMRSMQGDLAGYAEVLSETKSALQQTEADLAASL